MSHRFTDGILMVILLTALFVFAQVALKANGG